MGLQPTNLEETTVSQLTEMQGQTGDGRALGGHIASCNITTSFTTIWLGLGLGLVSGRHFVTSTKHGRNLIMSMYQTTFQQNTMTVLQAVRKKSVQTATTWPGSTVH